jgi:hypothetical protein
MSPPNPFLKLREIINAPVHAAKNLEAVRAHPALSDARKKHDPLSAELIAQMINSQEAARPKEIEDALHEIEYDKDFHEWIARRARSGA